MIGVWRAGRGKERALSAGLTLTLVADAEMSRAAVLQPEHIRSARQARWGVCLRALVTNRRLSVHCNAQLYTTAGI